MPPLIQTMRLDLYLFENGLAHSRTFAKSLILEGAVSVDGRVVTKPSYELADSTSVSVKKEDRYVSRGAYKLAGAVESFNITVKDRLCIDIGASSGGFTDYLIKNGAAHVICVDSGTDQLVSVLRSDERVTVFEGYNARYMKKDDFSYTPSLAVMDVSFISATYIIPSVYEILAEGGDFVCLIKPQFEVGRQHIGKGGIVKDDKARIRALERVTDFAQSIGFSCKGTIKSPISGGDGNIEFLAHFVKTR